MKPTWTKVYSGPGYPIDPAKQAGRDAFVMRDFIPCHPNNVMGQFFNAVTNGIIGTPIPKPLSVAELIATIALEKMFPTKAPKCNCLMCSGALGPDDETVFRHMRRHAMIHTEDFRARLMAIEVKEGSNN